METNPCVKCGSTERYKPPPGRKIGKCKVCRRAQSREWRKNNPDKKRTVTQAYRKANPEKFAAHKAVKRAVYCGDLPLVSTCDCRDCGIQAAEYHHEDYSKPLDVEPLCISCHKKRHNPDN